MITRSNQAITIWASNSRLLKLDDYLELDQQD